MTTEAFSNFRPRHIETCADQASFVARAVALIVEGLAEAIGERGRALLAVPGGSTPGPVFDALARTPLDWAKVTVILVDERLVDASSPDSNERLVRERLLQGPAAAAHYERLTLDGAARLPLPFDVVLLGMGEDGHIASIFPGSVVLPEAIDGDGLCLDVPPGNGRAPPQARRTLSLRAINDARRQVLMIAGHGKIDVFRAGFLGRDPYKLPVSGLLRSQADLYVLLRS